LQLNLNRARFNENSKSRLKFYKKNYFKNILHFISQSHLKEMIRKLTVGDEKIRKEAGRKEKRWRKIWRMG